jgi:hypothetical protein
MSRTDQSSSSREWSHMYSDHKLCSPSTCGVAQARELVQSVQQAVWLNESGEVLIPRTVTVEVLDDPVLLERDHSQVVCQPNTTAVNCGLKDVACTSNTCRIKSVQGYTESLTALRLRPGFKAKRCGTELDE